MTHTHAKMSLAQTIVALEHHLPAVFFTPRNISQILRITSHFPAPLARVVGFECKLGRINAPSDLLFLADVSSGGRDILAGRDRSFSLDAELASLKSWGSVGRFTDAWSDPQSALSTRVDDVWFEFDLDGDECRLPQPSVFFGPKVAAVETASMDDPERRALAESIKILSWGIALLRGEPISPECASLLRRCGETLPAAARIFQAGLMLSRPQEVIRLCITNIPSSQISRFLAQMGWEGAINELDEIIDWLSSLTGSIKLTFDIGSRPGPRIGLECYPGTDVVWKPGPRWQACLEELVRRGLCVPEDREALLAYPGISTEQDDPAQAEMNALLEGRATRALVRWLHHVKITYEPNRPLSAKAYLAARHDWLQ
jgi:hypothetical protein